MIVDAHVHIFPPGVTSDRAAHITGEPTFALMYERPEARTVTAEELIAVMDEDGVAASVVCAFPWRDSGRARMHNDYVLEAARAYPGRLVPLAGVDPLAPDANTEAERALAAGARGLGEIGVYQRDLGEPEVMQALAPLAALCAEANRPLLLHTNEPVGHAYPGKSPMSIRGLYILVKAHPRTRFQLAHLGGGLFFFEALRKEIRAVLSNCVFDTAAAPYLYRPALYPIFLELAGAYRLLYGSDFPLLRLARYQRDLDQAEMHAGTREAILGGNARSFWGF